MDAELIDRFSVRGRGGVVIGAASGIGRETAIVLARAGATLTIADIDEAALAETAALVRPHCPGVSTVGIDVRERAAVQRLADEAERRHGIDIWTNVAGVIAASTVADTTPEAFDRIVGVNMAGTYWGCAAAARIMMARRGGSIINISSAGADVAGAGLSVYAMTKAAVNILTRTLAHEVGPSGVRVNAVAPGFIDTPMVAYRFSAPGGGIDEAAKAEIFAARAGAAVLGRIGQPIDIALAILYLASNASDFMTGQVIRPNGGMVMP